MTAPLPSLVIPLDAVTTGFGLDGRTSVVHEHRKARADDFGVAPEAGVSMSYAWNLLSFQKKHEKNVAVRRRGRERRCLSLILENQRAFHRPRCLRDRSSRAAACSPRTIPRVPAVRFASAIGRHCSSSRIVVVAEFNKLPVFS